MKTQKRIVVTGLGAISPLGLDVESTWQGILASKSGISAVDIYDNSAFTVRIGGVIKDFDATRYIAAKDVKKMDPFIRYGIAASIQAVENAGIDNDYYPAERVGVAIGSGIGGLGFIEKNHSHFLRAGPRKISPFFVPSSIINMIAGHVAIRFGFAGPNFAITSACATGLHNIGHGARMIAYGDADAMVVGGSEMATTPIGVGGFASAKALSTRNDDPQAASRPWDQARDGFVLSDGAAIMVLEEYEHAKKRNANILAEIIGFGMSCDAHHITTPSANGAGAAASMRNALNDADIELTQVGYINAHGTSTMLGDQAEAQAIKSVFGDIAKQLTISSTKSMIGHMLGASGAIESIFSILALKDQVVPPTINLDNPDEGLDLDLVPHTARQKKLSVTLCNSFGFGGTNGTLVFAKV